ncbi:WxL domain-containing protein [Latilactobacillus sakei]|uniref:WxL domain-containing protein n=1 Tax=Latilactobacillus sakei TaxID=1599 RepID=UPI003F539B53
MNKLVKMLTVSSATLMGVVGLSQLTPVHAADTTAKSVGTLEIKDGTQTLTSVDNLDFGDVAYDANGMSKDLEKTNENATVKDTTFSQTAWTISGQTDSTVANLTINGQLLSKTPAAVFTKTTDAKFGEQTAAVKDANMSLTASQAVANGTKAISMDVNWTLAPTTRSANFN